MDITMPGLDELELMEEAASSQFDFSFEIDRTKQILNNLKESGQLLSGSFSDNKWTIKDERDLQVGSKTTFDFNKLGPFIFKSNLKLDLKLIVKCWICSLLEIQVARYVSQNYRYLLKALELSHGFAPEHKEFFKKALEDITIENTRYCVLVTVLNFIDYSQIDEFLKLIPTLQKVKAKTKYVTGIRTLPPSRDVLQFDYILNDFFEKLSHSVDARSGGAKLEAYNLKLLFYPVLIWWKLTNIIPMRPSEFCLIKRNCIVDKCYISLPRTKLKAEKKRRNNVQIYDKIIIDTETLCLITEYFSLTEKFGETKTLVSYRAIAATYEVLNPHYTGNHLNSRKNCNYFNIIILRRLLQRFYDDVVFGVYGVTFAKEKQLRPGDTRHFAFINMMMQGVPPVEIARIGGHSTIVAQYHYSSHVEYWIDSTIDKLLERTMFNPTDWKTGFYHLPNEITDLTIKKGTSEGVRIPLELGYCTDKEQRCETDILDVSGCMFGCRHWRISKKEFVAKKELIIKLIVKKRRKLHELHNFMVSLHDKILSKEYQNNIPTLLTGLTTTAKLIDHEVKSLARYKGNPLGGGVILNE